MCTCEHDYTTFDFVKKNLIMKIFSFILIASLLKVFALSAQQADYEFLVDEMCSRIDVEEFKAAGTANLNLKLQQLGEEISNDHPEKTGSILETIQRKNPGLSDQKIMGIYLKDFLKVAFDRCDKYAQVVVLTLGDCPEPNPTLELITKKIDNYLSDNESLTLLEKYNSIGGEIFNIIIDNEELVKKDYPDGSADPRAMDDAILYLFHNSRKYLKVSVLAQIERGYN